MATTGPSLLLSLLDVVDLATLPTKTEADLTPYARKYLKLSEEKKKEVQKKLYDNLYFITEYPGLPQNEDLSMAIGRALARVLKEELFRGLGEYHPLIQATSRTDNKITKLRDILYKTVTEAIDEAEKDKVIDEMKKVIYKMGGSA